MPFLQDLIHQLELGGGKRFFRVSVIFLALVALMVCYDWRAFRNMSSQEAMDTAQLGRNIAEGKGYTTLFVRPVSIYLVRKTAQKQGAPATAADLTQLKTMHPDLANPPVYPGLLAGLMKVLPFRYALPANRVFYRYQPDLLITIFNQVLFFVLVLMLFSLTRRLFDASVAWVSALLVLATELFWHFTVSGLSTILLMVIFTGLVWSLVWIEQHCHTPGQGGRVFLVAALAGACVGIGGLTRYSFAWLMLPVFGFLVLFGGPRRILLVLAALLACGGIMAPWIARNLHVSGLPFGTATFSVLESTFLWPGTRLQRSLEPNFSHFSLMPFWVKLVANLRAIVGNDLPRLGGTWVSAFFLASLLVPFRNPTLRRVRVFLLFCLPVFVLVQALGRTQLSEDSPEINSENLLVILAPLVIVYGVGFFFVLLDQINLPMVELRVLASVLFGLVTSLPLLLIFLPPKTHPVVYPPYNPPAIQSIANWLKPSELSMSDLPWAMAWYGERQSVWLTLKVTADSSDPNTHEDFLAINDYQKPIVALYLTPRTIDARFFSEWIAAGELSWGSFILQCLTKEEVPPTFPLSKMPRGWLKSGELVLTDWERWSKASEAK